MKAIRKEFHVEIRRSFGRFVSILLIVALGVAFYAGIRATEPDMRITGDSLYDENKMMDIKILCTLGLSDADIDSMKNISNVERAEGAYSADVIAIADGSENVIKFMSVSDNINTVTLQSGKMPTKSDECILDQSFMNQKNLKIGETISIRNDDESSTLKSDKFKITGIFTTAMYMSSDKGNSSVGTGKISGIAVVARETFDMSSYTEAYISVKGAQDLVCYSDEYHNLIESVKDDIDKNVKSECINRRYDEVKKEASKIIIELKSKIDDTNKALSDADKTLKTLENAKELLGSSIYTVDMQIDLFSGQPDIFKDEIAKLNTEKAELQQQYIKCNDGIKKTNDGIKEGKNGIKKMNRAIKKAEESIDNIKIPKWYILDRTATNTYVEFDQDAMRLNNIGKVFPIIFFFVAALVSLTSMTRMIKEQRTQIGTLKALGYSKFTISMKYVKYAMFATVTGSLLGSVVGVNLLPVVILNAYRLIYPGLGKIHTPFNFEHTITATIIAIICVLVATLIASYRTLTENAATLMRPESPKIGKQILLERVPFIWNRLKFNSKSAVRNMIRYKKRFFMTLFGISGCMGLIIAGFGIKDSTSAIVNKQYGQIHNYDASVTFNSTASADELKTAEKFFTEDNRVSSYLKNYQVSISIEKAEEKKDNNSEPKTTGYMLVPKDRDELKQYVNLCERVSGKKLELSDESVIIDEKLSTLLSIKVGDTILLGNEDNEKKEVKVGGITENYLYHYIYISPKLYKQVFGEDADYNEVFLKTKNTVDDKEMAEDILQLKAASSALFISTLQEKVQDVLRSIDIIVLVLVVSAGLLAFVVLYNLNNINISERIRELATLKVLGFYDREVDSYVIRENVLITILGIIIGCFFGAILHQFVIRTAEIDIIMFGRTVKPLSFLYSAIITVVFAVFINFIMHFKLKKIDMAESMKSVE